ncbi:MAG: hypothetical protein PHP65_07000, partial [Bacilli bacterium]|nr:hypothetical protein [Bacilli bacterium]
MSKKKSKSGVKKKNNAKKNSNTKKGLLSVILLVILVLVTIYFGIKYYPEVQQKQVEIEEVKLELSNLIPSETSQNIVLPETIVGYDDVVILWESNDEATLTKLGVVNNPNYDEEDKLVKLTATLSIDSSDTIANIFFDFFKVNYQTIVFDVIIKSKEANSEDKIAFIKNGLFVPSATNTDIGLLKEDYYFNSVTISWQTSNENIMTSTGKKGVAGEVILTATLTCEDKTETVVFPLQVTDQLHEVNAIENK